jgi:hypothetical protein
VLELVRLLLENGADRTSAAQTRRDDAAPRGRVARVPPRVAQELLDAGADPWPLAVSGTHHGQTPADTALAQGHLVLAAHLDSGRPEVGALRATSGVAPTGDLWGCSLGAILNGGVLP